MTRRVLGALADGLRCRSSAVQIRECVWINPLETSGLPQPFTSSMLRACRHGMVATSEARHQLGEIQFALDEVGHHRLSKYSE